MPIVTPKRRWRPTKTDRWILSVGIGLIAGGLIIVLRSTNDALWTFAANSLLTVGVAISLVGIIFRVQLDIQDELVDARRERLAFEEELRGEIAVINERVRQTVEALQKEAPDRNAANALRDRLARELAAARRRASELETQIEATTQAEAVPGLLRAIRVPPRRRTASRPPRSPRRVSAGDIFDILLTVGITGLLTFCLADPLAYVVQQIIPSTADNLYGEVPISLVVTVFVAGPAWVSFFDWDFDSTRRDLSWRERLGFGVILGAIVLVVLAFV